MALNMPPSEFKPVSLSDNPRHWKGDIGLMNTSNTSVVFTIESLIAFLKTHQVEVDSNLNGALCSASSNELEFHC